MNNRASDTHRTLYRVGIAFDQLFYHLVIISGVIKVDFSVISCSGRLITLLISQTELYDIVARNTTKAGRLL